MQVPSTTHQGDVPEGFVAFRKAGAFAEKNGPIYFRPTDSVLGFCVSPAHCNPVGLCHGGWLSTFLDMQMPLKAMREGGLEGCFLVTVSLSLDFLAVGAVGSWIEGQATVLKRSKSLVFVQGLAVSGGTPLLRGSGVYKAIPRSS
ncbi:PaaI family thioesterase [Bradyrhizobium sp. AUGA SZCCT0240]|uniref:PaaI family thioesterase n=1 Tax=Bradyrhizobium sp. AUGA SZCCT0240 TaxID=2807669 RepID=UPI001BAC4362|nr:PaaI family thioesterase [Bradyrhizobium sp. AUGA SZCCT0240]MBR1252295.1 PaaI family thioesterase [Bradyrhizobium sp. AUGA SZCCT0240]